MTCPSESTELRSRRLTNSTLVAPKLKRNRSPSSRASCQTKRLHGGSDPFLGPLDGGQGIIHIDDHLLFAEFLCQDETIGLALRFQHFARLLR